MKFDSRFFPIKFFLFEETIEGGFIHPDPRLWNLLIALFSKDRLLVFEQLQLTSILFLNIDLFDGTLFKNRLEYACMSGSGGPWNLHSLVL